MASNNYVSILKTCVMLYGKICAILINNITSQCSLRVVLWQSLWEIFTCWFQNTSQ